MKTSLMLLFIVISIIMFLAGGCAGYKVDKDGTVRTWGIMRTLTVRKDYHASGKLKSEIISTDSTTKDVLCGLNELADTAVNTVDKLKP